MDLHNEQIEIEARMADRGVERYRRNAAEALQNGEATRSTAVQTVLDTAMNAVALAIEEFKDTATRKAGRRHSAVKALAGIDAFEAAFVSTRIVLDGMARNTPTTLTAIRIGSALELEARMRKLADEQSAYVAKVMSDLNGRTRNVSHRRAVLSKVLREKGDTWSPWGKQTQLQVGLKLIELLILSTGLFETRIDGRGKNKVAVLAATDRFKAWLHSLDTRFALMAPEYLPCVIPPKDWTGFYDGGYHTDALAYPPTLVKTSSKAHRNAIKEADLGRVLSAVNAIQKTAWAVNGRVLEVVRELINTGRPIAGLPDMSNIPLPSRPVDIDTNEEALKNWKREAARTYEVNRRVTGRRVGALKTLQVAEEFSHYPAIYFPHQLDFRGRVYPIPQGLNPQGNDLAKGLLHFAEGGRLDTVAAIQWFKVHGANCFGVDKVSMDERMAWVEENAEHIIRSAEDPLNYQWWADADSPFCFLAWAFEFNDWLQSDIGNGTFVSRVAVAMDGSCNGIQHYSAMLRDPRGGAAVNLVPSDRPQDIYGEVANVVNHRLSIAAGYTGSDEERQAEARMAAAWLRFGIDRKITKRPVMVLPYGGTQRSCLDYVYEAVKERGMYPFPDEALHAATVYLGGVVWRSISEVVVAAPLAMGWLRQVASAVTKEGAPLRWTTPVGFPVVQAYHEVDTHQVECCIFGHRFRPRLEIEREDVLDRRRQVNGVAPNFVHSLDAAALVDTVNRAASAGITNFAMIHDSYGTTAAATAILSEALRDAFVSMYEENDVLQDFVDYVAPEAIRGELNGPPFVGGLDLDLVRKSTYFFA